MEDYRQDGFNAGYGYDWKNDNHEPPKTEQDWYSYRIGYEDGQRRRRIGDELDRKMNE